MDYKKTGELIAAVRREKNLTQKELASLLDISDTTVSKWERGVGFPDVSLIEPLAQTLGISVAALFRGERDAEQPTAAAENLLTEVLCAARAEITRKRKKYIRWAVAIGCFALLWMALFIFPKPGPMLAGTYQSDMINGHCVQFAVKPADNTFVEYIDCRAVNSGTYTKNEDGTYTFDGDLKNFTVTLQKDNSFDIIIAKIDDSRVITLSFLWDAPTYNGDVYVDDEAYKDYLR